MTGKVIIPGLIVAAGVLVFVGSRQVLATSTSDVDANNGDMVAVSSSNCEQKRDAMKDTIIDRLNRAVSAGDLTETQKQELLNLHEEKWQNLDAMHTVNGDRSEMMSQHRERVHNWAQDNGVDLRAVNGGQMMRKGMGMHRGMMR